MIEWLDEFYNDPDLRETTLRSYLPVFSKYVSDAVGPVSSEFVQALAEGYVERYLGSSRAQLQEIVKDSENPVADLATRFTEWEEKRPGKVSANETVRAANAATLEQMRVSGVTHKRWVTQGTCPFCKEMAGRTTTVEKTFVSPGDALHPKGVETAMTITSPIGHPPLHQGCVCSVEAASVTSTSTSTERFGSASSMEMHQVGGKWTAERQGLHDRIMEQVLGSHKRQANRQIYLTGGGPASGKGSFAKFGRVPPDSAAVDPDAIKALLPEYQTATAEGQQWAAAFAHEESSYLSKRISLEAGERGLNLSLDTVGDGSFTNLAHKIEALRTEGSRVVADYATVRTDVAIERAVVRGQTTGRFVPEEYIREAHTAVSDVLPKAVDGNLFDEVRLWNTEAQPARLIMESVDGVTTIHEPGLWEEFLAKATQL